MADRVQESAEAVRLVRHAAELGKDDAFALSWAGYTLAFIGGEPEDGAVLIDRALELNPNLAVAWAGSGWVRESGLATQTSPLIILRGPCA
jgi:hypothetical protein